MIRDLDLAVYEQAKHLSALPFWIEFWEGVTQIGYGIVTNTLTFTILLFYLWRQRSARAAGAVLWAVILAYSIGWLKNGFQIPRPESLSPYSHLRSFAFPSGHAFNAVVLFYFLPRVLQQHLQQFRQKFSFFLVPIVVILEIAFVSLSRVFLGAHWVTDVIGGILYGITMAEITLLIMQTDVCASQMTDRSSL